MNDLIISNDGGPLAIPAHLQGFTSGVNEQMLQGIFVGGNRIGLKGSRFRIVINGKEEGIIEENYLDCIILAAHPANSRIFYEAAYDPDAAAAPTCYSADGIAPPDDVKAKQSDKCATCPQNVVGSKVQNGRKMKACGYFRRLVVMLAGDLEGIAYRLDVKAMGLFGESNAQAHKYSLNDYIKFVDARNVDMGAIVTRLSFDTDQSVPKLLFAANRFVTQEEVAVVRERVRSEEVKHMAEVNMNTVDLSGEAALPAEAEPAPAPAPVQTQAPQRAAPPAPQRPAPVAPQQPQRPAPPAPQKPAPAVQQVARPVTQVAPVAPPARQQVQKPTPTAQAVQRPQAQRPAPVVQQTQPQETVQEVGTDQELDDILAGLAD